MLSDEYDNESSEIKREVCRIKRRCPYVEEISVDREVVIYLRVRTAFFVRDFF